MKIWFISDTHTRHRELTVPDADVVVHCGDEANVRQPSQNQIEATDFFRWYSELEIETKIFVPGNHSTAVAEGLIRPEDYPSIRFLVHESATLAGLHIFGTPFTPAFFDWAYMKPRTEMDVVWDTIPSHIDLLISHGPPKGIRDVTRHWRTQAPIHVGSKSLMRQVTERVQPRIHVFGHLHDESGIANFGTEMHGTTQFINCSCVDLHGRLVNQGMVVDLNA